MINFVAAIPLSVSQALADTPDAAAPPMILFAGPVTFRTWWALANPPGKPLGPVQSRRARRTCRWPNRLARWVISPARVTIGLRPRRLVVILVLQLWKGPFLRPCAPAAFWSSGVWGCDSGGMLLNERRCGRGWH